MSYSFISLDSKTEELKAHLRDVCGIEKNGNKKELVEAILEYERVNGLERPTNVVKASTAPEPKSYADLPLHQQRKVKIKIADSTNDRGDVYVSINEWDALIKRNVEVAVPEAVYTLLSSAGDTEFEQNDDGSLTSKFVPRYHITVLGYE